MIIACNQLDFREFLDELIHKGNNYFITGFFTPTLFVSCSTILMIHFLKMAASRIWSPLLL